MPRDAVSRTANVGTWLRKRSGGKKWVKKQQPSHVQLSERRTEVPP